MNAERRHETKNRRLASLGAMLEYYDFVAYIYVAAAISQAFFPSEGSETVHLMSTFGIYAIGFVVRPVAGIALSRVADRVGRKKVFLLTLALMSAASIGIGILPTYATVGWLAPALLLLMRVLQGCAVGGELPAAAVFVSEFAGPARVGFSGAYMMSLAYGGFLFGAGAALASDLVVGHLAQDTPSLGWRLPFLTGGVLGLVALYLRRHMEETPAFKELERSRDENTTPQGAVIALLRSHSASLLVGFLIVGALTALNVVFFQYWPTYLQVNLDYSADLALTGSLILILVAMIAMPWWGRFADRYGWSRLYIVGGLASAGTSIFAFVTVPTLGSNSPAALILPVPAALSAASLVAAGPGLLASMFPTENRQVGYSIPYNVGAAIFGGLLPLSIAPLISSLGVRAPLLIVLGGCVAGLAISATVVRLPLFLGRGAADLARVRTLSETETDGKVGGQGARNAQGGR